MSTTLGVVEIRADRQNGMSGTLPSSLARRRFGGKTLLEWVVRRITEAQQLDQVVVVADREECLNAASDIFPPDIPLLAAQADDSLGCLVAAAKHYRATGVVRIDVHCPFIDPALIDRLVTTAKTCRGCDYVSYCSRDGLPIMLSRLGLLAEWFRTEALEHADRALRNRPERHDAAYFVLSHPELFQMRFIPLPNELDRDDLRLALEVEEDWEHAQIIFEALGPDSLEWQRIAGLLLGQPEIRRRMALLNSERAGV